MYGSRNLSISVTRLFTSVAVLASAMSGHAAAQAALDTCQGRGSRPNVGLGATSLGANHRISSGVLGSGPFSPLLVTSGRGVTADGRVPAGSRFGLGLAYGRSAFAVKRELSPGSVDSGTVKTGDTAGLTTLTVELVNRLRPSSRGRVCFHAGGSVGRYSFGLGEERSTSVGIAAIFGGDVALSNQLAAFVQFQITTVLNNGARPINAEAIFMTTLGAGVRFRLR